MKTDAAGNMRQIGTIHRERERVLVSGQRPFENHCSQTFILQLQCFCFYTKIDVSLIVARGSRLTFHFIMHFECL